VRLINICCNKQHSSCTLHLGPCCWRERVHPTSHFWLCIGCNNNTLFLLTFWSSWDLAMEPTIYIVLGIVVGGLHFGTFWFPLLKLGFCDRCTISFWCLICGPINKCWNLFFWLCLLKLETSVFLCLVLGLSIIFNWSKCGLKPMLFSVCFKTIFYSTPSILFQKELLILILIDVFKVWGISMWFWHRLLKLLIL
jgi:hypothetical protein